MKDVEVVIIMMPTGRHLSTHTAQEFVKYMFYKNLAEKCWYVVVRITSPEEGRGCSDEQLSRRLLSRSQEKVDPESIMRLYGLKRGKIKAKVCKFINHYSKNPSAAVGPRYRRSGFNCEYLLIANCEFFYVSQLIDSQT